MAGGQSCGRILAGLRVMSWSQSKTGAGGPHCFGVSNVTYSSPKLVPSRLIGREHHRSQAHDQLDTQLLSLRFKVVAPA